MRRQRPGARLGASSRQRAGNRDCPKRALYLQKLIHLSQSQPGDRAALACCWLQGQSSHLAGVRATHAERCRRGARRAGDG